MKITGYQLFKVPPRWLFLKIETDEGISGWGEPVVEGSADIVRTAVEQYMRDLIGKDPMRIQDHWQMMYRTGFYRGGAVFMSAMAGIDQALWDIKGKMANMPLYQLLGGKVRAGVPIYTHANGSCMEELIEHMEMFREMGLQYLRAQIDTYSGTQFGEFPRDAAKGALP